GAPATRSQGQETKAQIDRDTGLNLSEIDKAARKLSPVLLNWLLRNRTGATLGHQPRLEDMVSYARGVMQ
ncbi:hypothetical protein, partial [Tropicimonas aquimaris]